nr:hemerythrin domain-containing protein [Variovorax boronicumulans]
MSPWSAQLLPTATNMVRLDHTHVLSTFHQYKASAPARVRAGLANTICLALEVHAQLEEEIFYPAVRQVAPELLDDSEDEHQQMREAIARLRRCEPEDPQHEEQLMVLMRLVMHHVADEETLVLPAAERLLADQLGEIGLRMTRRRIALVAPRSGEIALNMGRAASGNKLLLAGGTVIALGLLWFARQPGWQAVQRASRR